MHSPKVFFSLLLASLPWIAGQEACHEPETCFFTEPATFSSVKELECGLGPDGPAYCHWSVRFEGREFQWHHSDYVEVGSYTCEGDVVTGSSGPNVYTGTWDAATGLLTWEGVVYQPM